MTSYWDNQIWTLPEFERAKLFLRCNWKRDAEHHLDCETRTVLHKLWLILLDDVHALYSIVSNCNEVYISIGSCAIPSYLVYHRLIGYPFSYIM